MKKLFILFLMFYSCATIAQSFGLIYTSGYWTIKDIQKDVNKEIAIGEKKRNLSSSMLMLNDTLQYTIADSVDGFVEKFVFNIKDSLSGETYCGYQEIIYNCTPCSQKHLNEYLSDKGYAFHKMAENKYMSACSWKTEMTVEYKSFDKSCLVVKFKNINAPKKAYKAYYKTLSKP